MIQHVEEKVQMLVSLMPCAASVLMVVPFFVLYLLKPAVTTFFDTLGHRKLAVNT